MSVGSAHLHGSPYVFFGLASRDTIEGGSGYLVDVLFEGKGVDVLDDLVTVVRTD